MTQKKTFYFAILNTLKESTNLSKIQEKLKISRQQLNYYLRRLKDIGLIIHKGRGWYEPIKQVKKSTKYGKLFSKDTIRGHAHTWTIFLKEIKGWDKRRELLKKKGINFKLIGMFKIPRIKVLGRKVWLCNNHLRIFDKSSYYGQTAIESRKKAFQELLLIIKGLEHKLGVFLRPFNFEWRKEHYSLIRNDLAIEHNRKGEIVRISDEQGEWLIMDDSLGEGGELETIGKKAFITNIPLQKWWNDQKKTKFEVTPSFLMESINKVTQNQQMFSRNIDKHMGILQEIGIAIKELRKTIKQRQTKLGEFI